MLKTSLDQIKEQFTEIVKLINGELGKDYAAKNPQLIMHLMGSIQAKDNLKQINEISN